MGLDMHYVSVVTTDPPSSTYRNGKLASELGATFYDALAEMAEKLRQNITGLGREPINAPATARAESALG